jgi:hypothetical protein
MALNARVQGAQRASATWRKPRISALQPRANIYHVHPSR